VNENQQKLVPRIPDRLQKLTI